MKSRDNLYFPGINNSPKTEPKREICESKFVRGVRYAESGVRMHNLIRHFVEPPIITLFSLFLFRFNKTKIAIEANGGKDAFVFIF